MHTDVRTIEYDGRRVVVRYEMDEPADAERNVDFTWSTFVLGCDGSWLEVADDRTIADYSDVWSVEAAAMSTGRVLNWPAHNPAAVARVRSRRHERTSPRIAAV